MIAGIFCFLAEFQGSPGARFEDGPYQMVVSYNIRDAETDSREWSADIPLHSI